MKMQVWQCAALLSLSTLFWSGCASAQGSGSRFQSDQWWNEAEATLAGMNGLVELSSDGAEWRNGFVGQAIKEGDRLRTGPGAEARVDLGEERGGIVRVRPNSVVIFEQLSPPSQNAEVGVIMNLPQGRVVGDTARTPAGQKILVKTPNGMHEVTADGK